MPRSELSPIVEGSTGLRWEVVPVKLAGASEEVKSRPTFFLLAK